MRLAFLGAAGEVTGSCYLVEAKGCRFLVDCGMFQGGKEAERKNRNAFEFNPETIDFVLLTHAHIDHSGLLPRLVAQGFKGRVYATQATIDLLGVMLPDSAHIQEKEAEWENYARRGGRGRGRRETAPLYTVAQAQSSLRHLTAVAYDSETTPHPAVRFRYRDAGHILGSAIVEIWLNEGTQTRKIVFSGDLGQPGHPLVRDPTPIEETDYLLVESTYGNRLHKSMQDTLNELTYAVNDTLKRKGGNVIIPAFAVGRTQDILYLLGELTKQGKLSGLHIYVDSPMATSATEITLKHLALLDPEAKKLIDWGNHGNNFPKIEFIEDVDESRALNNVRHGVVIISASGMCDAGRIKHHLRYNLGRRECSVIITGFQAGGTLGRRIVDGAKTVRIFREEVPVRAEIYTIGGLSAHADQKALMAWLGHFHTPPQQTFVVHGEVATAHQFADLVQRELKWKVRVPELGDAVNL